MWNYGKTVGVLVCGVALVACAGAARGDIVGLNGLSGWTYNTADTAAPPVIVNNDLIQVTGGPNNRRSFWYNTPQDITSFQMTFTYRASSIAASTNRQGITFTMQNAGLNALGSGGDGLGYQGITPSAAVTIAADTGPGQTYSAFYTGGLMGGGSAQVAPVNAFTFQNIDVTITYNGSILSVFMAQGANTYGPQNYLVGSLASTVGGSTALVGFTAATFNTLGAGGGATQFISNVQFTAIPAPASALLLLAGCPLAARRRRG
ncbi:MAG TPA: hypothetical protein VHN77_04345 [Phycisphaerales bacterium]|nr:hypothetical protein [Phycisphaerales bacterium]